MIENAKIVNANLSMADHGVLCLWLELEGDSWGVGFGGYVIGHGYLGAKEFRGYEKGTEEIMRIMDTVGVETFNDLVGKYVRVEREDGFGPVYKIGNLIEDKWFDYKEFYKKK